MHLRRNKSHQEQNNQRAQALVTDESFNWDRLSFPKAIRELAGERKALQKKMDVIENRLRFGYSEPLYDYKMQLVKEDLGLSCKMTEILVAIP